VTTSCVPPLRGIRFACGKPPNLPTVAGPPGFDDANSDLAGSISCPCRAARIAPTRFSERLPNVRKHCGVIPRESAREGLCLPTCRSALPLPPLRGERVGAGGRGGLVDAVGVSTPIREGGRELLRRPDSRPAPLIPPFSPRRGERRSPLRQVEKPRFSHMLESGGFLAASQGGGRLFSLDEVLPNAGHGWRLRGRELGRAFVQRHGAARQVSAGCGRRAGRPPPERVATSGSGRRATRKDGEAIAKRHRGSPTGGNGS
jgi:hypothetical protein